MKAVYSTALQAPAPPSPYRVYLMQPKEFLFNMDRRLDDFTQNSPTPTNSAIVSSSLKAPGPTGSLTHLLMISSLLRFPSVTPSSVRTPALPYPVSTTSCELFCAHSSLCEKHYCSGCLDGCPSQLLILCHISVTHHLLCKAFLCYPIKSSTLLSA